MSIYTKLLLHFDSIPFTDSSNSSHSVTNNGATLDTVNTKFSNTGYFNVSESDYLEITHHTDFDFGTGDWTVDCWFKLEDTSGADKGIVGMFDNSSSFLSIAFEPSNYVTCSWQSDSGYKYGRYYWASPDTSFHHLAVVRTGTELKVALDGTFDESEKKTGVTDDMTWSSNLRVGARRRLTEPDYLYWRGNLEEVRISKGIARWTTDFTPPTEAYTIEPPFVGKIQQLTGNVILNGNIILSNI